MRAEQISPCIECPMKEQIKLILKIPGNLKVRLQGKPKVFVIGANKTGTTSMNKFLQDLGYRTGPQRRFEMLRHQYYDGDWQEILKIIHNYEAFQDVPFSKSTNLFISKLRRLYPTAKFILTTRDDASEWYASLIRFQRKLRYGNKAEIEWCDVQKVRYRGLSPERSILYMHNMEVLEPTYKKAPYDQKVLESWYDGYNERIMQLFKDDVNFIRVNLKDHDSTERIKTFLGKERSRATLLKLNTTK